MEMVEKQLQKIWAEALIKHFISPQVYYVSIHKRRIEIKAIAIFDQMF